MMDEEALPHLRSPRTIAEQELPNLQLRVAALESELGLGDSDDWSEDVTSNQSYCDRCWHCMCRSVTVPLVFFVSVLVAMSVIIFCIFPASIILVVVIACYYCCARETIPFRVLVTAMLGADSNDGREPGQPARTAAEIHSGVIKRRCLGASKAKESEIQKGELLVETDNEVLLFSQPLTVDEVENKDSLARWLAMKESVHSDDSQSKDSATSDNRDNERLQGDAYDVENGGMKQSAGSSEPSVGGVADEVEDDPQQNEKPGHDTDGAQNPPDEAPIEDGDVEMDKLKAVEDQPITPTEVPPETEHAQDDSESHSCDICLLPFEEGQIVAWSYNPRCEHAYHLDCITDWLIKQKTCPNCRADYLRKK